jgi:tetratricopeptide (TPR) repeat protein
MRSNNVRSGSVLIHAIRGAVLFAILASRLTAQDQSPLGAGYDAEQRGDWAEAAADYRKALHAGGNTAASILGLERVFSELNHTDSLLPILDTVIAQRPRDAVFRSVQLRALRMLGRQDDERAAFERWVRDAPRDATPYRDYARALLEEGRARTADSVLDRAQRALGSGREFLVETAQLRATMGLWDASARAWRTVIDSAPDLSASAAYALRPTPAASRDKVRAVFIAPPITLGARRALATVELSWGEANDAWFALSSLRPDSTVLAAWDEFGDAAAAQGEWRTARDAFAAIMSASHAPPGAIARLAIRAGDAALRAGDAASALAFTDRALATGIDSGTATRVVIPLEIRALAALGRANDADVVLRAYAKFADDSARARFARDVAWGYVRSGDIARARTAVAAAGLGDDRELAGWLALYAGDLGTARIALRQADAPTADLVTALALLARTRADTAAVVGHAFVDLARGDTAAAATQFVAASDVVRDAAPLLLATAARLHAARHEESQAIPLWKRVVEQYADAPEAPEADLEWGRALARGHDVHGALSRWEHLILTYPSSALVPQARREVEAARGSATS